MRKYFTAIWPIGAGITMFTLGLLVLGPIYYLFLFCLICVQTKVVMGRKKYDFKIVHEWKQIEYKFNSDEERSEAILNGTFKAGRIQPIDAQYTYNAHTGRERIFISTPRLEPTGYPATLGVVTDEVRDGNPVIDPYPSWSWHLNPEKCNYHRMVTVFRTWVDECNKLWIIDDGIIGSNSSCPPQLLAFDLKTDKLLHKYEVPYDQYQNVSWYVTPIAEVEDTKNACENTWIYVADPVAPGLLVYNLKQNTSWRVQDESFQPNQNYSDYTVAGDSYSFPDGILAIALSPATDPPYKRKLHYHAMSDIRESWIYTKHLKNRSNFQVPYGSSHLFFTYKDKRNQQSAMEATDRKGNLYFSLLLDIELIKWNPNTPYKREYFEVIGNNKETMQFPTGLKVLPYKRGACEALWVFATSYQRWEANTLYGNRTNFRLLFANL